AEDGWTGGGARATLVGPASAAARTVRGGRGPGMDDNPSGAWPEAAVAELRWLVEEGRPVAEIARRLRRSEGEVRGAIEAHRLWPYATRAPGPSPPTRR